MLMFFSQKETGSGRGPVPAQEGSPLNELVPIVPNGSRPGFDDCATASAIAARTAVFGTRGTLPHARELLTACACAAVRAAVLACAMRGVWEVLS